MSKSYTFFNFSQKCTFQSKIHHLGPTNSKFSSKIWPQGMQPQTNWSFRRSNLWPNWLRKNSLTSKMGKKRRKGDTKKKKKSSPDIKHYKKKLSTYLLQGQHWIGRCNAAQFKSIKTHQLGRLSGVVQWQILSGRFGFGRTGQIGLLQRHSCRSRLLSNRHVRQSEATLHHDTGLFISVSTIGHWLIDGAAHFELCGKRWEFWQHIFVSVTEWKC
jgi:hypothetical protein